MIERDTAGGSKFEAALIVQNDDGVAVGPGDDSVSDVDPNAGRRSDALRLLEELKKLSHTGYVPAGAFVNAYLGLGDNEQAFAWMDRACQEQSNILQFLKVHPFFDPVRSDPRFKDLLHRVGVDKTY